MKDYLQRNIWILSELYKHLEGVTYGQFVERWGRSSLNSLRTGLPKRTFHDCINSIEEMFGVNIVCDKHNGYRYKIEDREWIEKDHVKDWLLSTFAVNTLLKDSRELKERIVFEEIPSGNEHLMTILEAMRDNHVLRMENEDYFDDEPRTVVMEPYLTRVFKKRWYVIGPMTNKPEGEEPTELTNQGNIRRYALDRINHVEATEETFVMPKRFSAEDYFSDAFGIIVEPEEYRVENIRVKVFDVNHRRNYLRSLPLHPSQKETERKEDYSIFEFRLSPTYDFIQELLSMGGEVEILSPDYVRQEIKRRINEMHGRYQ